MIQNYLFDIDYLKWLDLPNLSILALGSCVFGESLTTVIESKESKWVNWLN